MLGWLVNRISASGRSQHSAAREAFSNELREGEPQRNCSGGAAQHQHVEASAERPCPDWESLPSNCLHDVFELLARAEDVGSVKLARAVCRSWRQAATDLLLGDTAASKQRVPMPQATSKSLVARSKTGTSQAAAAQPGPTDNEASTLEQALQRTVLVKQAARHAHRHRTIAAAPAGPQSAEVQVQQQPQEQSSQQRHSQQQQPQPQQSKQQRHLQQPDPVDEQEATGPARQHRTVEAGPSGQQHAFEAAALGRAASGDEAEPSSRLPKRHRLPGPRLLSRRAVHASSGARGNSGSGGGGGGGSGSAPGRGGCSADNDSVLAHTHCGRCRSVPAAAVVQEPEGQRRSSRATQRCAAAAALATNVAAMLGGTAAATAGGLQRGQRQEPNGRQQPPPPPQQQQQCSVEPAVAVAHSDVADEGEEATLPRKRRRTRE